MTMSLPMAQSAMSQSQNLFLEHNNTFTLLTSPPQSQEIHIMDVQRINVQQLRDAIMSV